MVREQIERKIVPQNIQKSDYGMGYNFALKKAADIAEARERELLGYCSKMNDDVSQTLGKALGYPWFKDSPEFPNATEADGVCVGDHVAESIAVEAANKIKELREHISRMIVELRDLAEYDQIAHEYRPVNAGHLILILDRSEVEV